MAKIGWSSDENERLVMIENKGAETMTTILTSERSADMMAASGGSIFSKSNECLMKRNNKNKTNQNRRRAPTIKRRPASIGKVNQRRWLTVLLLIVANLVLEAGQSSRKTSRASTCNAMQISSAHQRASPAADDGGDPSPWGPRHDEHREALYVQIEAHHHNASSSRHKRQAAQMTKQGSSSSASQPAKGAAPDLTRIVAVSGQTIEFQCPLANELLATAHANSDTTSSNIGGSDQQQQQQQLASRIIWRKDGQPLSQMNSTRLRLRQHQNSSSLTILQALPKLDEAAYECALADDPSKVHQFHLKLLVPPRLAPFEFPADAQVGMKVLLTCSALEGQQPISFLWLRDNQIIDSGSSPSSPSPSSSSSGGEYHSSSSNGGQRQRLITTLGQLHQQQLADKFALSAHSAISLGDKSEYVLIGGGGGGGGSGSGSGSSKSQSSSRKQHHFDVDETDDDSGSLGEEETLLGRGSGIGQQAAGKPKSATMHLADSSIRIRQADDYSILSIDPLELKHSGHYTCSAQNEAARVSHSSQLIINAPPTLTVEPKDGDLVSGHSIVIDCAASGQPRPTLSWLRARESNGGKQWDFVPIYENLRYTILSNGSLVINNVTQREQGFYMCSAKNGFGPEVTKLIKITVHEPARISSKYKLVEARVEEQAQMNCEVEGEPPLSLVWLDKEGKQIDKNDKRFIIDDSSSSSESASESASASRSHQRQTSGNNQASSINASPPSSASLFSPSLPPSSASSSLIITRAARSDSGYYTCQAINKHGQDKMVVNLLVQDVPDKVGDLKVTNVTASTISLRWQLGFTGNSPVTSYLVQYQSDDPLDDLLMSVAKTSNQATTSGQQTGEPMASTTQATSSGLSPSRLYHHLFGVLNADKEQQDKQQQQQASSIKAALEALNSLSAPLSDLSITTADEAIDRTLVELTVEQTATSLTIKDLSPFCVYRLRLAGINKVGLGEFSDWIRAKTEEAPPSGSALKIAASATGPNSIKLTWFPPDRRTWNGQLVRFQIGYRPIDSTYEFNKSIEWTPPTLMQSIMLDVDNKKRTDLNGQDAGKQETNLHSTTSDSSSSNSSSMVAGSSSANSRGLLESGSSPYALRQHLRQLLAMQQQELVAHLTNLQRSTTYLIWIQAINGRGSGPQSHAISVKTLDDVPPSAPALRVQSTSTNSITIAWSMLSNFISPANQYSLFYRRVPPPSTTTINQQKLPDTFGQQQQQRHFYPSRQQSPAGPLLNNNASLAQHQTQNDDSLAIFSEPGPFIERTITSQQLMHAIGQQQSGIFQLDESSDLSQQQLAKQLTTNSFQASHHQAQQQTHQQHYQQFIYTLDQLECGSIYELYMTTRNSVGKSEPSPIVTTRTLGEPPLAPQNKNSLFARIGAQDVLLNLASWSTGGCPLTHVSVRYKQLPQPVAAAATSSEPNTSASSTQTNNNSHLGKLHPSFSVAWPVSTSVPPDLLQAINQQHHHHLMSSSSSATAAQMRIYSSGSMGGASSSQAHLISGELLPTSNDISSPPQAQFSLKSLQPSTSYELEIVAHNAAGHTTAQYEFVTAGPNGSRSGYTRREGVYRLDQRGQPIETGEQQSAGPSFASDHQNGVHLQGSSLPSSSSSSSIAQQLMPLVLTLLCFICLIISSAFCYHRLSATWKQRARRHSLDGMRSICSGSNGGGGGGSSSNDSHQAVAGKTTRLPNWSMLNGAGDGGPHAPARYLKEQQRRLHSELVDDQSPSSINTSDSSPNEQGFHYCLPDQQHHQQQQMMGATLNNPKSTFTQSVSMRDFNMIGAALGGGANGAPPPGATLNINKSGRTTIGHRLKMSTGANVLANDFAKIGATIARGGRLETGNIPLTEAYGNVLSTNHKMCLTLGACKQKQDQVYGRHHHPQLDGGVYGPSPDSSTAHACSYQIGGGQDPAQSHETSWTTSAPTTITTAAVATGDQHQSHLGNGTNYAIPAYQQHQIETTINEQTSLPYSCDDVYGQGTIDACIQHLMSQQYHQEQQQAAAAGAGRHQQYATMLVTASQRQANEPGNQLQNRCNIYGEPGGNASFVEAAGGAAIPTAIANSQPQSFEQHQRLGGGSYTTAVPAQSIIESSSSSSGIGVDSLGGANHLDCASTITSTTTTNLINHQSYAQQAMALANNGGPIEQQQQYHQSSADMDCN